MAIFNAIGDTTLGNILTKRLVTPGGTVSPSVAPEVFPTITLESDRPEWLFISNQGLYGAWATIAGAAGNRSSLRLFNPPDSNVLCVIEEVQAVAASGNAEIAVDGDPQGTIKAFSGTPVFGVSVDGRTKPPTGQFTRNSHARINPDNSLPAGIGPANRIVRSIGTSIVFTQPLILGPNTGVTVAPISDNVAITAAFYWRERGLNPSERL